MIAFVLRIALSCRCVLRMENRHFSRHAMLVSLNFFKNIFNELIGRVLGCGAEILINEVRMFGNCSCGVDIEIPLEDSIATEGACGMSDCKPYYIAFQGLVIVAAALIASTLVGKLIIAIRAVLPQDKALSISIELFLVGIIAYVPGKFGYAFLAGNFFSIFNFNLF